jgi:4-hydroxybenzoate polyprenyltransferase
MQVQNTIAVGLHHHDALNVGMFLGGALMALVPLAISAGFVVWIYKQRKQVPKD